MRFDYPKILNYFREKLSTSSPVANLDSYDYTVLGLDLNIWFIKIKSADDLVLSFLAKIILVLVLYRDKVWVPD